MNKRSILVSFARQWVSAFLDPRRICAIGALPRYFIDWHRYRSSARHQVVHWLDSYPCLSDRSHNTPLDFHYFYQASWAMRRLVRSSPAWHVDIGSSVNMVGMICALIPTIFVDFRPLTAKVEGLISLAADLRALPFYTGSIHSLSCLHVIEHVGLGRYGDKLDPRGSESAAQEISRVLKPGGQFLLSLPVGIERVQFNAHRIFSPRTVLSMFDSLELTHFSMVDDNGNFTYGLDPAESADCRYACGLFEFRKFQLP
jgi:SAM-dependent methyltransferase